MDLVSVLMCTYREPVEWICKSVESIINQTYENLEIIIIVDDPSQENIISTLEKYREIDARIKIHINKENLGLVKSLNYGLNYCSGKYIARMDADDISMAERIEKQIKYLESHKLDLVGCGYSIFCEDEIIRNVGGACDNYICKKILKYASCVAHPTWLSKRELLLSLKYRDIDTCEDFDLLQRAIIAGYTIGNCPHTLFMYRDNPNSISHAKHARQRTISDYICSYYKKNEVVDMETYYSFINGDDYKRIIKVREEKFFYESVIKDKHSSVTDRLHAFLNLLFSFYYIKRKIELKIIKYLRSLSD